MSFPNSTSIYHSYCITGLTHSAAGLALVQELVKLHGGCVSVESDYGRGSTFKIAIPLGRNHLPAKQIGAARTQASTALGARTFLKEALRWLPNADLQRERLIEDIAVPDPAGTSPNERACILLADDNADMRDYVQRLLASRYEVVAVADGEAALAAVACRKPDLVLTDIMMPRVDGMEMLARLRSNAQTSTLPIIMLSARAGEESRVEGLHAGADDYLIKPFSARELLARVEAHVKMARFRHEASAALRESEARFRHMADHAPVMIWVTEPNGSCTFLNKSWYDFTGERAEASLGFGWFEATHPDDRASACNTFLVANSKREPFRLEYRLRRKDGEYRWTIDAAAPHFGETGNFLGYIGSIIDISERKRAEETQQLLVNELSHRVKNTLASVAVVARRTSEKNGSAEDFIETLDRRIHSMAYAHELLSRQRWQEVSLADLVNRELAPYTTAGNTVVEGPHVGLPAAETQAMAMVLHELATNAAKYGALSTPNGRVLVRWHSASNGGASAKLRLEWREDGGPPVTAPVQSGYGTSVIRDLIPYELGGTVELEFRLDGVRCTIEIAVECDVGLAILRTASDALQSMGDHDPHR
jgi:PAS domain S-box-containing protein